MSTAILCAGQHTAAGPADPKPVARPAYFEGRLVEYTPAPAGRRQKTMVLGPWRLGPRMDSRNKDDKRPNLYVVAPGTQYTSEQAAQYDHTAIVSAISKRGGPTAFDVYWAVVLDPNLQQDFYSENDLLLAAQDPFEPGDAVGFDDLPGALFLRSVLQIDSIESLEKHRRPDGTLPRLLIVPAGCAIRAMVTDPLNLPATPEAGLEDALKRLKGNNTPSSRSITTSPDR